MSDRYYETPIVEAFQYDGENSNAVFDWISDRAWQPGAVSYQLGVVTVHGVRELELRAGDWVVFHHALGYDAMSNEAFRRNHTQVDVAAVTP